MTVALELPQGVALRELQPNVDHRGIFTELFREQWDGGREFVQWNAVRSRAGVLRGVHAHLTHDDYLTVPEGRAVIGLKDLRPRSETYDLATCVELSADTPRSLTIPAGVAHGFYFVEPSLHVYAVTHYWDLADELGCRWDDPDLGIPWPQDTADISERDEALGTLSELKQLFTEVEPR